MSIKLNTVIAGEYSGSSVIFTGTEFVISGIMFKKADINKQTVLNYTLTDRAPFGMFGGTCNTVSIDFIDGKRSLITLSDDYYNKLITILY